MMDKIRVAQSPKCSNLRAVDSTRTLTINSDVTLIYSDVTIIKTIKLKMHYKHYIKNALSRY